MPEIHQKRMSVLVQGIDGLVCFIDDIVVIGRDQQEHDSRLHTVLHRLQGANVTLNGKLEICARAQIRRLSGECCWYQARYAKNRCNH